MSEEKPKNEMLEDIHLDHNGDIGPTITAQEERALIRKLDWHLLPLLFVLYMLSVLDRSNLGNAKLAGLEDDIDLKGLRYNWLGTLFYIAYILFQWTLIGWKVFKPHQWCAFVVFFWGFVATIQATVSSWAGLMTCRFFLGVAESMYGPGVPLYLSFFYAREKVGFRHGIFISAAAMANAYGGALAYGLSHITGSVAPWKLLFIIEGIPTCLIAILAWFFIPDSIGTARFLTDREKAIAAHLLSHHQLLDSKTADRTGLKIKELLEAFKDPKSYIPPLMYFSINVSFASLPLFLPTIISEIGAFSKLTSNGLSAPPYLFCFFVIIILTWISDKTRMRGPYCSAAALVAAIGFIILATATSTGARYFATYLAVLIFCSVALVLAWTANLHATESKRAGGYAMLATIGQCGPLLGTNVFPSSEAPYYRKGMWISASFCLFVSFLSASLTTILIRENKKMDREGVPERLQKYVSSETGRREEAGQEFRYII